MSTVTEQSRNVRLSQFFRDHPQCGERMTAGAVGLYLDYSKNRVTADTITLVLQLAKESGLCAHLGEHHDLLIAKVFAQAEALAPDKTCGQVEADGTPIWLIPHRDFEGNCPSNTILAERLTPETLDKLVAHYDHSVFTQGTICG